MASPRPFTFTSCLSMGFIWERRLTPKPSPPAQAVTDFTNVYAGCNAVTAVTPIFYLDESYRGSIFSNVIECCINKSRRSMMAITNFGNDNDLAVPLLFRNRKSQPEQRNREQAKDLHRFVPCSGSSPRI